MKKLLISFGPSPSTSRRQRAGLDLQGGGGVGQRRWPARAGPAGLDAPMQGPRLASARPRPLAMVVRRRLWTGSDEEQ